MLRFGKVLVFEFFNFEDRGLSDRFFLLVEFWVCMEECSNY